MGKSMRNFWIDVLMALLAVTLALSAFLLWVILPQGYFAARLLWLSIHKWTGLALSLAVLLHVLLHGRWLLRMARHVQERLGTHSQIGDMGPHTDPEWL